MIRTTKTGNGTNYVHFNGKNFDFEALPEQVQLAFYKHVSAVGPNIRTGNAAGPRSTRRGNLRARGNVSTIAGNLDGYMRTLSRRLGAVGGANIDTIAQWLKVDVATARSIVSTLMSQKLLKGIFGQRGTYALRAPVGTVTAQKRRTSRRATGQRAAA